MSDTMEAVEAVIDRMLKNVEDASVPKINYGKMGLNWRKVQSSLKGREVYGDKYMEENCSDDLGCSVVRIFDVNPTKKWPLLTNNIILGGYPLMRMPFVADDRNRDYLTDEERPITWYIT